MITANNGILIVALLFSWGVEAQNLAVMWLALIAALLSWVANVSGDALEQWPLVPLRALYGASAVGATAAVLCAVIKLAI